MRAALLYGDVSNAASITIELLSILVYGRLGSSGFPGDFRLVDSGNEFHVFNDVDQLTILA